MEDFYRYTLSFLKKHSKEKQVIAEKHLERIAQGREVWNKWAEEFSEFIKKFGAVLDNEFILGWFNEKKSIFIRRQISIIVLLSKLRISRVVSS